MDEFRNRLQKFMKEQGLNPLSLSKKAGLAAGGVRDLLQKTSHPRVDTLSKLCKALDKMPHELDPELDKLYPPEAKAVLRRIKDLESQERELAEERAAILNVKKTKP